MAGTAPDAGAVLPPGAAPAQLLAELALAARASLSRLRDEVTADVFAAVPVLSSDPGLQGEAVRAAEVILDQLLELLADPHRPIDEDPPPEVLALVGSLVRRGAEPADLLQACRIGQNTVWRWLLERVTRSMEPGPELVAVLRISSGRVFARTDVVVDRLMRRWFEERERWAGGALARRGAVVEALLSGERDDLDAASAELGYELDRWLCAAVLWDEGSREARDALPELDELAAAMAGAVGGGAALTLPAGAAAVWAWVGADSPPDVAALAGAADAAAEDGQRIALGTPGTGLAGFRHGHGEALHARRVAELSSRGTTVVRYDEVEAVSLLAADVERLGRFVERTLGALAAPGEPTARLRRTLRVWLAAGGSAPGAAVRLGVHKNTVLYRVHRAGGLLPRPVGEDRLGVELALAAVEEVGLEALLHRS